MGQLDENLSVYVPALTIVVIILMIGFVSFLLLFDKNTEQATEEFRECLEQKDVNLYVKLGCSHCSEQEQILGINSQNQGDYLFAIDCFYSPDICLDKEISKVPTWIIDGKKYEGVKSLEELSDLIGC